MYNLYGKIFNISPQTFVLPFDYTKFVEEFTNQTKQPNSSVFWIMKPANSSQGKGIVVFQDLTQLRYSSVSVVQRYIPNPCLIAGYKFDLRVYVCVPTYMPFTIYIYEDGLTRFATEKYNLNDLSNVYSHLTNTSLNKHSPLYLADKEEIGPGCKWSLNRLKLYMLKHSMDYVKMWQHVKQIICLTLLTQMNSVSCADNCFELYGFDILVDSDLRPWLMEVNLSPSLSLDVDVDLNVKKPLINDLFDLIGLPRQCFPMDLPDGCGDMITYQKAKLYSISDPNKIIASNNGVDNSIGNCGDCMVVNNWTKCSTKLDSNDFYKNNLDSPDSSHLKMSNIVPQRLVVASSITGNHSKPLLAKSRRNGIVMHASNTPKTGLEKSSSFPVSKTRPTRGRRMTNGKGRVSLNNCFPSVCDATSVGNRNEWPACHTYFDPSFNISSYSRSGTVPTQSEPHFSDRSGSSVSKTNRSGRKSYTDTYSMLSDARLNMAPDWGIDAPLTCGKWRKVFPLSQIAVSASYHPINIRSMIMEIYKLTKRYR